MLIRLRLLALWLFAGAASLAPVLAPVSAAADNRRPDIVGDFLGGVDISQGTSWSTLTSASFKSLTSTANDAAALGASYRFTELTIINTHATQTLYVSISALNGVIPTVTHRIPVGPGATITIPLYGLYQASVSIRGSGAATTGYALGQFVAR